jgi:hypothetical protein
MRGYRLFLSVVVLAGFICSGWNAWALNFYPCPGNGGTCQCLKVKAGATIKFTGDTACTCARYLICGCVCQWCNLQQGPSRHPPVQVTSWPAECPFAKP